MMDKDVLLSYVRIVLAIEMLEYENKNYLAYDDKRRCEIKMELLENAMTMLQRKEREGS
jgi:hypothetical protein